MADGSVGQPQERRFAIAVCGECGEPGKHLSNGFHCPQGHVTREGFYVDAVPASLLDQAEKELAELREDNPLWLVIDGEPRHIPDAQQEDYEKLVDGLRVAEMALDQAEARAAEAKRFLDDSLAETWLNRPDAAQELAARARAALDDRTP